MKKKEPAKAEPTRIEIETYRKLGEFELERWTQKQPDCRSPKGWRGLFACYYLRSALISILRLDDKGD